VFLSLSLSPSIHSSLSLSPSIHSSLSFSIHTLLSFSLHPYTPLFPYTNGCSPSLCSLSIFSLSLSQMGWARRAGWLEGSVAGPGRPVVGPGRPRGRLPANWAQRVALQQAQNLPEPVKIPKKRGPKPGSKVAERLTAVANSNRLSLVEKHFVHWRGPSLLSLYVFYFSLFLRAYMLSVFCIFLYLLVFFVKHTVNLVFVSKGCFTVMELNKGTLSKRLRSEADNNHSI